MMTKSDVSYKAQYSLILEELERMNEIITNYLSLARNKTNQKELKNFSRRNQQYSTTDLRGSS